VCSKIENELDESFARTTSSSSGSINEFSDGTPPSLENPSLIATEVPEITTASVEFVSASGKGSKVPVKDLKPRDMKPLSGGSVPLKFCSALLNDDKYA
jgi:hypothetical protein